MPQTASKFFLWVKQSHGCDYTIACGETLIPIEAKTFEEAQAQVKTIVMGLGFQGAPGDIQLEYLAVIEVCRLEISSIAHLTFVIEQEIRTNTLAILEERERKALADLKAKYEPPNEDLSDA